MTGTPAPVTVAVPGGALALRRWPAAGPARGRALLLHGFAADGTTWAGLGPALAARGLDALAPDLPSHGASRCEAPTLAALSDTLEAALDPLGAPFDLAIGHSLGALLAADLARRRPGAIRALLLIAPAGLGDPGDRDLLHAFARAATVEAFEAALARLGGALPPPPRTVLETVVRQNRSHPGLAALAGDLAGVPGGSGGGHALAERLDAPDLPVAVVLGRDDRMVPWQAAAGLPAHAAIHLVPGVGHVPHWEAPDLCLTLATRLAALLAPRP